MSLFVQQNQTICDFDNSDSWVILSPIEQSIKRKIEAVGTPLKDWDVRINYGIKTGYNDAFIITSEKREEILTNCKDGDERKRTVELIRPILRGRDIKRYGYDWNHLYLIATFPARHYDIEKYPAIKKYFLSFAEGSLRESGYDWVADNYLSDFCKQKLDQTGKEIVIDGKKIYLNSEPEKARKKTCNLWFETQDSIGYWEDFSQPKLVWAELARSGNAFVIDFTKKMVGNTGYILTVHDNNEDSLYYLLGFLNSRVILYCLNQITSRFDENGWRWLRQFVEQLRIPKGDNFNSIVGIAKSTNINNQNVKSEEINVLVAEYFGLTEKEYHYICDHLKGY